MSKRDVVKPGHFKLAGRVRPGKDTVTENHKQEFANEKAREEEFAQGTPPLPGIKGTRRAAAGQGAAASDPNRGKDQPMAQKGSMENLNAEDRKGAAKGVPGAFGKQSESTQPPQGDRHSALQRRSDQEASLMARAADPEDEPELEEDSEEQELDEEEEDQEEGEDEDEDEDAPEEDAVIGDQDQEAEQDEELEEEPASEEPLKRKQPAKKAASDASGKRGRATPPKPRTGRAS